MANYIPPDAHHVNLNFKDIATGSADLNFGADEQNLASLDATIDTSFLALFQALSFDFNALEVEIEVSFQAEFHAVSGQAAQLEATINTGFIPELNVVGINAY